VGFPNVGKSTLVNRLAEARAAVVHSTPGVTRDRKQVIGDWNGQHFALIDTGGVDVTDGSPITQSVVEQARSAVAEADLILFVVDGQVGVTAGDEDVAEILRPATAPVLVVANKIDDPGRTTDALDFHRLGLGDPFPISALHGHGTGDLLDRIIDGLPGTAETTPTEEAIRVAILGRPNVGKSSLLNALLGNERVIVSETPGTTRDSIDTVLVRRERTFVLIDTAGIRRKKRHRKDVEFFSEVRARDAAARADVALVMIDAGEGIVDQDLTVADIARTSGCATIVVLSKWDISTIDIEDARARVENRIRQRPQALTVSALTGRGLQRLLDRIEDVFDRSLTSVRTSELNRFLGELRATRPGPNKAGRRLNLLYITQTGKRPPRFRIFINDRSLLTRDYAYWVENQMRERFDLSGVPVVIDFIGKDRR
jgi:GTP-binding protein